MSKSDRKKVFVQGTELGSEAEVILKPRRRRLQLNFFNPPRTKQAHKDDCDINNIVRRNRQAGVDLLDTRVALLREHFSDQILDAPKFDFQDAMNRVVVANEAFASLPSEVRSEFDNNPAKFVKFATNKKNEGRLIEWGLMNSLPLEAEISAKPTSSAKGSDDEVVTKKP